MGKKYQADKTQIIQNAEIRYQQFMKITSFPVYAVELIPIECANDTAEKKGFGRIAYARYDFENDRHMLTLSEGVNLPDYLLFHEFTHILDDKKFLTGIKKADQKKVYLAMHGYEEYHASQVELMNMLGARQVDDNILFSMNDHIHTFYNEQTVEQYLMSNYNLASDLFSRPDFPADEDTLAASLGLLYNYWGLRSICEMYARNYKENVDNNAFLNRIGSFYFAAANNEMHGWLGTQKAIQSNMSYAYLLFSLKKQMDDRKK